MSDELTQSYFFSNGKTFDYDTFVSVFFKKDNLASLVGKINGEIALISVEEADVPLYIGWTDLVEDVDLGV